MESPFSKDLIFRPLPGDIIIWYMSVLSKLNSQFSAGAIKGAPNKVQMCTSDLSCILPPFSCPELKTAHVSCSVSNLAQKFLCSSESEDEEVAERLARHCCSISTGTRAVQPRMGKVSGYSGHSQIQRASRWQNILQKCLGRDAEITRQENIMIPEKAAMLYLLCSITQGAEHFSRSFWATPFLLSFV